MQFYVGSSPHIKSSDSTQKIMLRVIIALSPAFIYSAFVFGPRVFLLLFVAIISCVGFEVLVKVVRKKPIHVEDFSAVITAMLLVMVCPPSLPVPHIIIGSGVAILFGKEIFGGLGCNVFNPALVGRAFLQVSFPARMINYAPPVNYPFGIGKYAGVVSDSVTAASGEAIADTTTAASADVLASFIDAFTASTPLSFMKYSFSGEPQSLLEKIAYESNFYLQSAGCSFNWDDTTLPQMHMTSRFS